MRRYTRPTNAFPKKIENHLYTCSLYTVHDNFCRRHKSLKGGTPAMAAGSSGTLRDTAWIVGPIDARAPKPNRPKTDSKRQISNWDTTRNEPSMLLAV